MFNVFINMLNKLHVAKIILPNYIFSSSVWDFPFTFPLVIFILILSAVGEVTFFAMFRAHFYYYFMNCFVPSGTVIWSVPSSLSWGLCLALSGSLMATVMKGIGIFGAIFRVFIEGMTNAYNKAKCEPLLRRKMYHQDRSKQESSSSIGRRKEVFMEGTRWM